MKSHLVDMHISLLHLLMITSWSRSHPREGLIATPAEGTSWSRSHLRDTYRSYTCRGVHTEDDLTWGKPIVPTSAGPNIMKKLSPEGHLSFLHLQMGAYWRWPHLWDTYRSYICRTLHHEEALTWGTTIVPISARRTIAKKISPVGHLSSLHLQDLTSLRSSHLWDTYRSYTCRA